MLEKYNIMGFLASGTYGRVYKASVKHPLGSSSSGSGSSSSESKPAQIVAIKKFKPDKEGDVNGPVYTGISQSACREIMVRRQWCAMCWAQTRGEAYCVCPSDDDRTYGV